MKKSKEAPGRWVLSWILASLVPLVIVGGYFWPYLGYLAIGFLAILLALVRFRGRYYCGWICPMGAFMERVLAKVSRRRPMLPLFKARWFKGLVLVLMLGLLASRLILSGGDPKAIGAAFVMMWTLSTGLAVALGLIWKPRSWCSFCPMGTVQGWLAPKKRRVRVSEACRRCGLCKKACPVEIDAGAFKDRGVVPGEVCLRCEKCVALCPRKALFLEGEGSDPETCQKAA